MCLKARFSCQLGLPQFHPNCAVLSLDFQLCFATSQGYIQHLNEKKKTRFYFEFTVCVLSHSFKIKCTSKSPLISFWPGTEYCLSVHFLHVITNIFISLVLKHLIIKMVLLLR